MGKIKRIDIKKFRSLGYLQEANRLFFHPLGLALEVVIDDDGRERLGGVWDSRDDAEGILYSEDCHLSSEKADKIEAERRSKAVVRCERFGQSIQPIPQGKS